MDIDDTSTDDVQTNDNAANQKAGGTGDDKDAENNNNSRMTYEQEKALRDLHKAKDRIKELESSAEKTRLDDLKSKENYKELAEDYRAKAEASEGKYNTLESSMIFDKKFNAVKQLALKSGLRKEAERDLELINLDDVQVEFTSTGKINVLHAESALKRLKSTRPHWFGGRNKNLNTKETEAVFNEGEKITFKQLEKAELEANKTGDYTPYHALHKKYREQLNS